MKKIDVAYCLYKMALISENESSLYLSCLDKIKETMTDAESREFSELIVEERNRAFYKKIKKVIDDYFKIDISERSRNDKYSYPRNIYFYFCYIHMTDKGATAREIANYVGLTHSSLYTGYERIKDYIDVGYRETVLDVKQIKKLIDIQL